MQIELNLLLVSLLAGVLTVVSPCIMSLFPIIIGGSVDSNLNSKEKNNFNYKKAITVVTSLAISVLFFTFVLKVSTVFINVPELFWKSISAGIIFFIGLVYIFPKLWSSKYLAILNSKSNILLGSNQNKKSFLGNMMIGFSLGPIFATCSPTYFIILATVLPVSLFVGSIYMLVYVLGMSLFLLALSFISSKILSKLEILTSDGSLFKKALGILFMLISVLIITGADKKIALAALENGYFDITKIEISLLTKKQETREETIKEDAKKEIPNNTKVLSKDIQSDVIEIKNVDTENKTEEKKTITEDIIKIEDEESIKNILSIAPEFVNPNGYINTNNIPISLKELRDKKVVLVSIWTFSCINCKRTLPYLNSWYEKYKNEGLEIIGVHTPEFAFEKVKENVEDAVRVQGIKYPVILDNDYETWNAYDNNYWPHRYLVDQDGHIIYEHIGEGDYEETELQIQKALKELNKN